MKVSIYSREAVEALLHEGIPSNTAIISFYDPPTSRTPKGYKPVDYSGIENPVMQIPLHDIDIEILGEYNLTYETYFPETQAVAAFVCKAFEGGIKIYCANANTVRAAAQPVQQPLWSISTARAYPFLPIIGTIPISWYFTKCMMP